MTGPTPECSGGAGPTGADDADAPLRVDREVFEALSPASEGDDEASPLIVRWFGAWASRDE